MRGLRVEALLWAAAFALSLITWTRVRDAVPVAASVAATPEAVPGRLRRLAPRVLASAAETVRRGDPFRLDRSPPLRFGPAGPAGLPPPASPPAPILVLAGVIGPPWRALIEGIPGHPGAVVLRPGERLEELRVVSITRTGAVLQGADTTWRLTLKRSWQ